MERSCRVSMLTEKNGLDPKLDNLYRSASLVHKAKLLGNVSFLYK